MLNLSYGVENAYITPVYKEDDPTATEKFQYVHFVAKLLKIALNRGLDTFLDSHKVTSPMQTGSQRNLKPQTTTKGKKKVQGVPQSQTAALS